MKHSNPVQEELIRILREKFRVIAGKFVIPPPVFIAMRGEVLDFDIDRGFLKIKFPVLNEHLNPFGNMQGGMIAAAVDNTLGPLSMAVAPPNFTRHFEIKYRRAIPLATGYLFVSGYLEGQKKQQLCFSATVMDSAGQKLAAAKSTHWIIDQVAG